VAIAAVMALPAVNYLGVAHGSRVQALFTIGKVLAIAVLIAGGFLFGSSAGAHFAAEQGLEWWAIPARDYALALIAGLFTFGGWHMVTYSAEETVNPRRTIPLALLIGVLVVTICYIALNAAYLYVLPLERVAASTRIAADAASVLVGPWGAAAMSALVVFSTFGALNGIILAGPRVYFAMARDGLLFRWVAGIHPRFETPHRAIALQAVWSSVLVATGTYRQLFTRVIYTEWIFFGLMAIGLFLLRRRAGYAPDYRTWGYPFAPAVFAVASFVIVANQIATDPVESATGLLLVVLGLPIYAIWLRKPAEETSDDAHH
jgi:APA family basic amino acid/polyamine antiporter